MRVLLSSHLLHTSLPHAGHFHHTCCTSGEEWRRLSQRWECRQACCSWDSSRPTSLDVWISLQGDQMARGWALILLA